MISCKYANSISKEYTLGLKVITCGTGHTSKGYASMKTLDPPCTHHKQSKSINTVALRSYLKEVSPPSLTTSPLSTLNETLGYSSFTKMDISCIDWELERKCLVHGTVLYEP